MEQDNIEEKQRGQHFSYEKSGRKLSFAGEDFSKVVQINGMQDKSKEVIKEYLDMTDKEYLKKQSNQEQGEISGKGNNGSEPEIQSLIEKRKSTTISFQESMQDDSTPDETKKTKWLSWLLEEFRPNRKLFPFKLLMFTLFGGKIKSVK